MCMKDTSTGHEARSSPDGRHVHITHVTHHMQMHLELCSCEGHCHAWESQVGGSSTDSERPAQQSGQGPEALDRINLDGDRRGKCRSNFVSEGTMHRCETCSCCILCGHVLCKASETVVI